MHAKQKVIQENLSEIDHALYAMSPSDQVFLCSSFMSSKHRSYNFEFIMRNICNIPEHCSLINGTTNNYPTLYFGYHGFYQLMHRSDYGFSVNYSFHSPLYSLNDEGSYFLQQYSGMTRYAGVVHHNDIATFMGEHLRSNIY